MYTVSPTETALLDTSHLPFPLRLLEAAMEHPNVEAHMWGPRKGIYSLPRPAIADLWCLNRLQRVQLTETLHRQYRGKVRLRIL